MSQATTASVPVDDFATRLLLARRHAGMLTVREAAMRSGLHYATWSTWERGVAMPSNMRDVVVRVSEALGVDRDWLMWGGPLAAPRPPSTPLPTPKSADTPQVPNEVTGEYLRLRAA